MAEVTGMTPDRIAQEIAQEIAIKADASTVNDLAAVTTGFAGVVRRNSRRIRELASELVSELGNKADKTSVDSALDLKADASTVDELSALVLKALGVGKRNATQIRHLVADLATKADMADMADLSTLTTSALGVGKRNATQIRHLVAAVALKVDASTLTAGLATKVDTRTLDARIPDGGHPGQLLMATPTGARWSWADRYPIQYHDVY